MDAFPCLNSSALEKLNHGWTDLNKTVKATRKQCAENNRILEQYEKLKAETAEWLQEMEAQIKNQEPAAIDVEVGMANLPLLF